MAYRLKSLDPKYTALPLAPPLMAAADVTPPPTGTVHFRVPSTPSKARNEFKFVPMYTVLALSTIGGAITAEPVLYRHACVPLFV